jgi:hypothetical protein
MIGDLRSLIKNRTCNYFEDIQKIKDIEDGKKYLEMLFKNEEIKIFSKPWVNIQTDCILIEIKNDTKRFGYQLYFSKPDTRIKNEVFDDMDLALDLLNYLGLKKIEIDTFDVGKDDCSRKIYEEEFEDVSVDPMESAFNMKFI